MRRSGIFKSAVALVIAMAPALGVAKITLAPPFTDHAVLQHGTPVPVWGRATPGSGVTVAIAGQSHKATVDDRGRWEVELDAMAPSSRGTTLRVTGVGETIQATDVLIGDVWLCSGQSNMAWTVSRSANPQAETAASDVSAVRHMKIPLVSEPEPAESLSAEWVVAAPDTSGDFSAVAFFFARMMHEETGIPVGVINASWGGSVIEAWLSAEGIAKNPYRDVIQSRFEERLREYPRLKEAYEVNIKAWQTARDEARENGEAFTQRQPRRPEGYGSRQHPGALFNGMIHPLLPIAVRGVLWYQGENNANRHQEYPELFAGLIKQWRETFRDPELPFYFVQLANLNRETDPERTQWAYMREAQATALSLPNTGMAVAIDIGESDDIHPKNKQDAARRLGLLALSGVHGHDVEASGPVVESIEPGDGVMKVTLQSKSPLVLKYGNGSGFQVAGADRKFYPAKATIENFQIVVASEEVPDPVALRYAWHNDPEVSLFNEAGLPAAPFRTDDW